MKSGKSKEDKFKMTHNFEARVALPIVKVTQNNCPTLSYYVKLEEV